MPWASPARVRANYGRNHSVGRGKAPTLGSRSANERHRVLIRQILQHKVGRKIRPCRRRRVSLVLVEVGVGLSQVLVLVRRHGV